jgi:histidinol-phosphate aminotransferase
LAAQKNLDPSHILLGNGSDEVLDLIFRAFCEPGKDNVITAPPTYGMYKVLAEVNNIENREVFLNPDFSLDAKSILSAIDACTKIIFLCSPNNPTGNCFKDNSLKNLVENFNGLLVLDEAYIDFTQKKSWISNLDTYPNLIVTQTFSKAYGMAGIRLGTCYASEQIINVLNKIKPPYNINELTQKRALEMTADTETLHSQVQQIVGQRSNLQEVLSSIQWVEKIYPSEANFILVKVDNADHRYRQLLDQGVVVRNRSTQALCENTLRLTIGTEVENDTLIEVIKTLS